MLVGAHAGCIWLIVPEYRAITTLLPRIATVTLLILLAGTFISNNDVTGSLNKPMYIGILVLGFAITALFLHSQHSTWLDTALAVLASGGLIWGILTIERLWLIGPFWNGFGESVAIGVLVLLLVLGTTLHPPTLSILRSRTLLRWLWLGLGLIVVICSVCDLLSLIRTLDFMPIVSNNVNEVNDVLGPIVGNAPDSTYIPQYTALYGWLFVPVGHLLSPHALVGSIAIFFSLLDIACVLLAVWITRRALGTRGFLLAIAFVVPITSVTSSAGEISSIASLFQELPIRLVSGFIIAALGLNDLVLLYRGTLRIKYVLLLGVVCGVVAWNSQDFGLAAAGVYGLMILLGATRGVRWRALGVWCAGFIIGAASYPLFLLAIGSPLNLSFVGAFVALFASGYGSVPIQVPGPVLIVMPIVVCSVATGWALLLTRHRESAHADPLLDRATVTLAFVGTWVAICMVYYVNRAFAAGQLQSLLLPCGVCIGALYSILVHSDGFAALTQRGRNGSLWTVLSIKVAMIPAGIFISLCFASALLTPNPIVAVSDVVNPPPTSSYLDFGIPQLIAEVRLAQRYTSERPGGLTYLGESFNYVWLATHVHSNALFFPEMSPKLTQIQCQYLRSHHSQWMILSPYSVRAYGNGACGIYRPVTLHGLIFGQLQELK
jgi:hypothetical protein